jgi:hypothetical protein
MGIADAKHEATSPRSPEFANNSSSNNIPQEHFLSRYIRTVTYTSCMSIDTASVHVLVLQRLAVCHYYVSQLHVQLDLTLLSSYLCALVLTHTHNSYVLLEEWLKELKATLTASLAVQATENILKDSWLKGSIQHIYIYIYVLHAKPG